MDNQTYESAKALVFRNHQKAKAQSLGAVLSYLKDGRTIVFTPKDIQEAKRQILYLKQACLCWGVSFNKIAYKHLIKGKEVIVNV